jgi:hypothetical protein
MRVRRAAACLWIGLILLAGLGEGCDDAPAPHGTGPCTRDADCAGVCARDPDGPHEDLVPLELACAEPTPGAAAGEACEEADDCQNGLCLLAGACAGACAIDADCAELQRCQSVFARTGPDALQPLTACVASVDLPRDARVEQRVEADVLSGGSAAIELARVTQPTLIVLEHPGDERWPDSEYPPGGDPVSCRPPLCLDALSTRGAAPVTLWDLQADTSLTPALNPVANGAHVFVPTLWLPNGSDALPDHDGLELQLTSVVPGDLRVTRLAHTPGGLGLDLNVFYVGALDWVPTGSRGPPELEAALEELERIYAPAGVFVGEVRQVAVPGALPQTGTTFPEGDPAQGFAVLQERYRVLAELPALFELSAGAGNTAIDLFFVADVAWRDGELEGLSGGVPGPLGMHGTGSSGVVFATDMMQGDPRAMGRTLAHEVAHFLGLFHTSEADGSAHDPLRDTAQCTSVRDLNGDARLSPAECEGAGADNLMFWAKTEAVQLSADQIRILKQALVLR